MTSNAQKVLDVLESMKNNEGEVADRPFYFDMTIWTQPSKNNLEFKHHPCGTVGCILGIIEKIADSDFDLEDAADWLNFDHDLTGELFCPSKVPLDKVTDKMATKAFKFAMSGPTEDELSDYWETLYVK